MNEVFMFGYVCISQMRSEQMMCLYEARHKVELKMNISSRNLLILSSNFYINKIEFIAVICNT